jgi:hypothetical protein
MLLNKPKSGLQKQWVMSLPAARLGWGLSVPTWGLRPSGLRSLPTYPEDPSATTIAIADLARWLPDGCLEFLGRLDSQIKEHSRRTKRPAPRGRRCAQCAAWQRRERSARSYDAVTKTKVGLALLSLVLLMTQPLHGAEDESTNRLLTLSLSGYFHYTAADGFLQTPAGGEPGTSSARRPTLDELGIHDAIFYDALASVRWRQLNFYGGYQAVALDGDAVLSQELISRGATFPAGTRVQSQTDLNWFRIGIGWIFPLATGRWEISPKAELAVLDFNYRLSGGTETVDRGYAKGAARLGLESRYRITRRLSVSLDGAGSIPLSNTPQLATLNGLLEYKLFANSRVHPALYLGVGAQRIEYEDNQKLPNHFRVDLAPLITAGLGISF